MKKRSVTLDPMNDMVVRSIWKHLIDHGWPRATYSLALNLILLGYTLTRPHITDSQIHRATIERGRNYLKHRTPVTEEEIATYVAWMKEHCIPPTALR